MPKFTVYKMCRICEGKKFVVLTTTEGKEITLMCASCLGRGHHVWGWMEMDGALDEVKPS